MKFPSTRLAALAGACAVVLTLGGPPSAGASSVTTRVGAAPSLPSGASVAGPVAASAPMHVTVTLRPRDPAALQAFADQVSTPGSPLYRDYLTSSQFAQRFGATPDQLHVVESSLRAHGLTPGQPSANNLSIPVTATASAVSRAFSVSFAHVALASGASAIVNQQAPSLDAGVASDVQSVLGLNTLTRAKPLLVRAHAASADKPHVITGGPQPCSPASATGASHGGLTDDQIASAYGLSGLYQAGDAGVGQTVAVLELEPYDATDLQQYAQCYGISPLIGNVSVDGGAGSGSGSGESALDIENVIGLAPNAKVLVYEGPNSGSGPYDTFSAIISQHAAQVVTASWGQCEELSGFSQAAAENTLFQEAAAEGISIFSASGDDGAEDCFPASPTAQVDDPASQPYVTGVGGTRIDNLGPRPTESAWNAGFTVGAGGGGVSTFWRMPAYQANEPGFLHVINAGSSGTTCGAPSGYCREVPDVSADADPGTGYLIYWNGTGAAGVGQPQGWQVVGGTSGAAPAWAALIALANASSACHGTDVGFANPALYHAAAIGYSADFNDTTTGNNDMTGANGGQFAAGPGYDMATGLGTPNGSSLAGALCTDAIVLVNPGAQRSIRGSSVSLQITAYDTHNAGVGYSATGLPVGLAINRSSGKVTGHPRRFGTSTVTITVSDAAGTGSRVSFPWTIQGKPILSRVSLTGVGQGRPSLSLTVTAGRDAPQLKTVTIALPRGLSFTRSRATVSALGVANRHLKFTVSLQHGTLVIKLSRTSPQVRVTVAYPRLKAGGSLAAQVTSRRFPRVTITARPTDAFNRTTNLTSAIKPRT